MRTTISERHLGGIALLALALAGSGCAPDDGRFELGGRVYHAVGLTQWALPKSLREISGLALDPEGRLFAHADERARIYQVDYDEGDIVKHFDLGDPPLQGDFEGIAWAEGRLYLVTSGGVLFGAEEGEDGASVDYERFDTGFGSQCEIEGLHYDPDGEVMLLACKTPRRAELEGLISVFAWSLRTHRPVPERNIHVGGPAGARLHPSGLTRLPGGGNLVLVASRQRALIELTPTGTLVRVVVMPDADRHAQMEGVEVTSVGDLIIADEGGNKRGRLGVYQAE